MRLLLHTVIFVVLAYSEIKYAHAFSFVAKSALPTSTQNSFRSRLTESPLTSRNCRSVSFLSHSKSEDDAIAKADERNKPIRTRFNPGSTPKRQAVVEAILQRFDTLRAAGINDPMNPPLVAGGKTTFVLCCLAFAYKCYRSVFINKMAVWERQPQWNTVMTSREMEQKAELKAMTCKNCGTTIFIAKGRKWFQMPKGYECYSCGASGEENFINNRDELLDTIEDDYFDYEKPLDFVSAAERKALMKEAGGDESKAIALLSGNDAEAATAEGEGSVKVKKKKKKKKKGKKKKKKAPSDGPEEGVDALVSNDASASDVKLDDKPDQSPAKNDKKSSEDSLDELDMDDF